MDGHLRVIHRLFRIYDLKSKQRSKSEVHKSGLIHKNTCCIFFLTVLFCRWKPSSGKITNILLKTRSVYIINFKMWLFSKCTLSNTLSCCNYKAKGYKRWPAYSNDPWGGVSCKRVMTGKDTLSETHFLMMNRRTRMVEPMRAAMMGPTTHTIPASSVLLFTDTSDVSTGILGFGRRGGSPGGTSLMSRASSSENGLDVYRCWNSNEDVWANYDLTNT